MIKLLNIVKEIIKEAKIPGTDINLLKVWNNNYKTMFTNKAFVEKYGVEAYQTLQSKLKNKEISIDDFNDELYIADGLLNFDKIPKTLYHGSPFKMEQKDLDPFIRSKSNYKQIGQNSGTSNDAEHIGISLGSTKTAESYFQRKNYKEAWLYEFTFKSDIKCLYISNRFYDSSVVGLNKKNYDKLRKRGIDMITNTVEYLLINPEKVSSFKPIKKWTLSPGERGGNIEDLN